MTAFLPANIPSAIATLEELAVWVSLALGTVNPNAVLLETQTTSENRVQVSHFNSFAKTRECQIRLTVPMDPSYDSDRSQKLWMFAQEISTTALPAAFTVN